MKCMELNNKLFEIYPNDIIKNFLTNEKELYLEVYPEKISEIALFLNKELGYPLVSLFANDEREFSGSFAIYYTFSDRNNGFLVILKIMIDPQTSNLFLSICDKIPAAAAYEREIKDLFGLNPLGHPDPKRLVFHSNWPDELFPLRKDFDAKY
ncbi:MAG: NADH-quinone oxidoreductase subunit C [Bacillota bacterium]